MYKIDTVTTQAQIEKQIRWEHSKRGEGHLHSVCEHSKTEAIRGFLELGLSLPEVALISCHREPRMLMRYTYLKAEKVVLKLS